MKLVTISTFCLTFLLLGNINTFAKNQDNGIQELVTFLTSVNSFLYNSAEGNKQYSPSSFNDFIQESYGDREEYSASLKSIQNLLNDNATLLGLNIQSEIDLNKTLNHILLSKNERLARFEGLSSTNSDCHLSYIKQHQQCLINAILDGMFERVNASVGSTFFNCLTKCSNNFFDCIN